MSSKSIYTSRCSCVICHREYFSHGFHTHYQRIHLQTKSNYKNQTHNAQIASQQKSKLKRIDAVEQYDKDPKKCTNCQCSLLFDKRQNKHCSSSCAATYSNARKDYSVIKSGPAKGSKPKHILERLPFTKIKQCDACSKFHPKPGKSCSEECKRKLISISVNRRIDAGWNPQENRCKSTPSYLERSFKNWLETNNIVGFVHNKTFRCGKKIYYGDFFFPEKNLLIELDGKQHLDNTEYDKSRDNHIMEYHNVYTLRISYKEYISKSKIELVIDLLK